MDIESETRHSSEEDDVLVHPTKRSNGLEPVGMSTKANKGLSHRPSYSDTVHGTFVPSSTSFEGMEKD